MSKEAAILVSYPAQQNPVLLKELDALTEADWKVTVISWYRKEKYPERYGSTRIDPIRIQGHYGEAGFGVACEVFRFWIAAIISLYRHRSAFSIIQCQDLNTLLPGIVISKMYRKKLIFDCHDPYPEMISTTHSRALVQAAKWMEKWMCRGVDAVITVNHQMKRRFEKICNKPVFVIYNYPDAVKFTPVKVGRPRRKKVVIGRIGSIQEAAGIEETVSAFTKCLRRHRLSLLFVGRISDSFRARFMNMIKPIRKNVEIVEDVPYHKIPDFYQRMDISMVLYPARGIAPYISPMKLFESMAMKVPVVATDVGEIRRTVEKSGCGIVIRRNTDEMIYRALRFLIGSPKKRLEFGLNGYRAIREEMNWEREKDQFVHAYETIHRWPFRRKHGGQNTGMHHANDPARHAV
jgi:glycosyltransferase involved in cell wall biosynthesis